MNIGRGLALSVLAAAVGAGLWVGLFALTGWSLGLLAIIIGGLAGFGMGMGNDGRGGAGAGLLAAAVTFVAVCGARFGVSHLHTSQVLAEEMTVTEEDAKSALAGEVYAEFEADGSDMGEWDDDEDEYPSNVMATAEDRWNAMSAAEQAEYTAAVASEWNETAQAAAPFLTGISFVLSFGLFGLIFLGLAMSTAYKIGSTVAKKDEAAEGGMTVESVGPGQAHGGFFARLGPASAGEQAAADEQPAEREAA